MTALDLTACMIAWLTAACFNCVFIPTSSSVVFSKTLANKLNIFQESIYFQQKRCISFLVSTAFISFCISFAAVSKTLNFCSSGSSGLDDV